MKTISVIAVLPKFIKAVVVFCAFAEHRPNVREILVHTGQYCDASMSDVIYWRTDYYHLDFILGIGNGAYGQNTGQLLEKLEELMLSEKTGWVMVYGDTDSTLAGICLRGKS